jgi:hypothetical protein
MVIQIQMATLYHVSQTLEIMISVLQESTRKTNIVLCIKMRPSMQKKKYVIIKKKHLEL